MAVGLQQTKNICCAKGKQAADHSEVHDEKNIAELLTLSNISLFLW